MLSQLLELRRYGKNNVLNPTVLVSWPCDKHGRDTNFWKVQPLRDHAHLLAKVSINIIFCSVSLYGLFLQGLVQFSSAGSHFLLLYVYTGMKGIWEANCSDLGKFFTDRWLCLHWEDSVLFLHLASGNWAPLSSSNSGVWLWGPGYRSRFCLQGLWPGAVSLGCGVSSGVALHAGLVCGIHM